MRILILFLLATLICYSCSNKNAKNIIPPEEMELIISDMMLAEGYSESGANKDSSRAKYDFLSNEVSKVLAIHKVTKEQYNRSFQYYIKRPDIMRTMIDSITSKAARNRDKIYNKDMRNLIEE
ncbi:MAG: DUF4296 domain-containing protein [Chitinophagaceae bacterium]